MVLEMIDVIIIVCIQRIVDTNSLTFVCIIVGIDFTDNFGIFRV